MTRQAARGALLLGLLAAAGGAARTQTPGGGDRFYVKKKDGSVETADGEPKVVAAGVQVGAKTFSPADVLKVVPSDLPGVDRPAIIKLTTHEEKKEWEPARAGYADLRKGAANDRAKKFLDFRLAVATARVADEASDEDGWKSKAAAAAKLLDQYLVAYPTGWEWWPVGRTLARTQAELGQFSDAASTWGKLAKSANLPSDLKQEAAFQEVEALVRAKRGKDAGDRADALLAGSAGAAKDRATVYKEAAKALAGTTPTDGVGPIEKIVDASRDPAVRAAGYAMIGELYLAAERPRDAMWAYLWVEVVYTTDKDSVQGAMLRLADVFGRQGEDDRARSYREKLRRLRGSL